MSDKYPPFVKVSGLPFYDHGWNSIISVKLLKLNGFWTLMSNDGVDFLVRSPQRLAGSRITQWEFIIRKSARRITQGHFFSETSIYRQYGIKSSSQNSTIIHVLKPLRTFQLSILWINLHFIIEILPLLPRNKSYRYRFPLRNSYFFCNPRKFDEPLTNHLF